MGFLFVDAQWLANWPRRCTPLRWVLKAAVRTLTPTHYVGAVAAIFDDAGRVLLVEHVFRTDYPWGLPGGWVSRGEPPSAACCPAAPRDAGNSRDDHLSPRPARLREQQRAGREREKQAPSDGQWGDA